MGLHSNSESIESHADIKSTWGEGYTWTDAVVPLPTVGPPTGLLHSSCSVRVYQPAMLFLTQPSHGTALQWAKRRGPKLHHGLLHSLFRKGKIKLFLPSDSKIKTISAHFPLPEGSKLLIPHQALLTQQPSQPSVNKPDLTTSAALALCEKLRHSVLYRDEELLIINKPQGLAMQGGHKIKLSLDTIMDSALASDSNDTLR